MNKFVLTQENALMGVFDTLDLAQKYVDDIASSSYGLPDEPTWEKNPDCEMWRTDVSGNWFHIIETPVNPTWAEDRKLAYGVVN